MNDKDKETSPVVLLDKVLKCVQKFKLGGNLIMIKNSLIEEYSLNKEYDELALILNKLIDDKYIYFKDSKELNLATLHADRYYSINFNGSYFLQTGGYEKELEKNNYDYWLDKKLKQTSVDINEVTIKDYKQTRTIAITACVISGFLLLLELIKWIVELASKD